MTKLFSINSETERINRKGEKKLNITNNNIIKRVKEFVPCKEYCELLNEIDEEEINEDLKNSIKGNDNNKKNNVEKNNISEEQKFDIINEKIIEEIDEKQVEIEDKQLETEDKKEINTSIEIQKSIKDKENRKNEEQTFKNKNNFDIYNISEKFFNDKMREINDLINDFRYSLYDLSYNERINLDLEREMMKKNREKNCCVC
jgi:hypothetical protein